MDSSKSVYMMNRNARHGSVVFQWLPTAQIRVVFEPQPHIGITSPTKQNGVGLLEEDICSRLRIAGMDLVGQKDCARPGLAPLGDVDDRSLNTSPALPERDSWIVATVNHHRVKRMTLSRSRCVNNEAAQLCRASTRDAASWTI